MFPIISIQGYESTIKSNWLYVQLGDFQDQAPQSWENKIHFETGGYDLLEFENLGIVSSLTNDSQLVYKSNIQFGFEITAHTYVGIYDSFSGLTLEHLNKYNYFAIVYTTFGFPTSWPVYACSWNSIDFDTFQNHDYNGFIPVTVGIKDIISKTGNLVLNGESFTLPEYKADLIQAKVLSLCSGIVGSYEDVFTDISGITNGTVELLSFDDQLPGTQKLIDYYNSYNLGFQIGDVRRGNTYQQMVLSGSQEGATFDNIDPAHSDSFMFNLFAALQPEVYEYVQYNTIRYAGIKYETLTGTITPAVGPATAVAPARRVAVHTENLFLHWEFIVDAEFYATMDSTAELTETILNDPYLKRGDWVWDTSIVGDFEVQVPLTNVLSELIGLIIFIIIAIIAIAIVAWIFLKRRRINANINVNIKK